MKKRITQEEFDQVKKLQELKFNKSQIAKITGRCYATIFPLLKFDTLDDYKQAQRERLAKKTFVQELEKIESDYQPYSQETNELEMLREALLRLDLLFKQGEKIDAKVSELQESIEAMKMVWEK